MALHAAPFLSETVIPPDVLGTAALTHAAFAGADLAAMEAMVAAATHDAAARAHDRAIALQLDFRHAEALDLQDDALAACPLYRVGSDCLSANPLRLLALMTPGDLMENTSLDFLTRFIDVRLDLLYLLPGEPLPPVIPDHDIAFIASSTLDVATRHRLERLFADWPRPVLNDPRDLPNLARDVLSDRLRGLPGIVSPRCIEICRADLAAHAESGLPPGLLTGDCEGAVLIRPSGAHAGCGLRKVADAGALSAYLTFSSSQRFFVTAFVDYRGVDSLFHKYRVAFVDRAPFLCHMASSEHWMVHYLNAGMVESAAKRMIEARAMASFDAEFASRHAPAFAALHEVLGFDFYSIDCAETRDGHLLIFEADTAAIIHLMDPPDLFPYKQPQMRRVFAAFERMLQRRADAYTPAPVSDFAI